MLMVGIDHYLKYLAIEHLMRISTFPVIQDVFHLTYVENRGAAFSILKDQKLFLIVFPSIILVLALYWMIADKIPTNFALWSIALIVGGGFGNLIDRIYKGYVVDYLDLRIINFAIFNFADCCIVIGTILFFIYMVFLEEENNGFAEFNDGFAQFDNSKSLPSTTLLLNDVSTTASSDIVTNDVTLQNNESVEKI